MMMMMMMMMVLIMIKMMVPKCGDDDIDPGSKPSLGIHLVDYFLNLFPVFTLSTNFPIIAITLRSVVIVIVFIKNQN